MTATYGEDSANQIFDMGAVYYYLIDNSTYVEAPETTDAETTEAENILEAKEYGQGGGLSEVSREQRQMR